MISGNIGLHPISASIMSGILVGAFMGTSTFHKGQSITIDGKVISFGDSGIFVDGIIAVPATRTVGGGGIHEVGAHDSKFSNPGGVFSSGEGLDADGNKTDAFTSGSGYRNGVSALIFALAAFMVTM
jgi:hypothetical protein